MKRDFFVYCVLLVIGLIGVYYVNINKDVVDNPNNIQWFDIGTKLINKILYNSKSFDIEVQVIPNNKDYFFIYKNLQANFNKYFKANKAFENFIKFFNPLYVIRKIGIITDEAQLKDYGINENSPILSVITNKRTLKLKIGKYAYGTSNLYVMDLDRQEVVLINGMYISQLEQSNVFYFETNLTDLDLKSIDIISIITPDFQKDIKRVTNTSETQQVSWADVSNDTVVKVSYGTWINKLLKLRITEYINDNTIKAKLDKQNRIMQLAFKQNAQIKEQVEVVQEVSDNKQVKYYIYTTFLGYWVLVEHNKIENLVKELNLVFK